MPSCPVCRLLVHGCVDTVTMRCDGAEWVECPFCGLLFDVVTPMPVFEGKALPARWEPDDKIWRALEGDVAAWRNVLDGVERRMPSPGESLLEVGCGSGHILDYAKEKGWKRVAGTEIVPDYVMFCRERGHEVHYMDIASGPGDLGKFDLILACQVMEHVVDLHGFVDGVRDCLSPDGVFWATFCCELELEDALVRRGEAYWWTMAAATRLLERSGLEVIDVERSKFSYNVMSRRKRTSADHFRRRA